jgi:uncharacterized protein YdaU (DUF1376 family)
MSKFRRPWFPWYPADYWYSQDVIDMTALEDLLYRRLLDLCWMCDGLPSDPKKLQPLTRLTPEEFASAYPKVSGKFSKKDGVLWNERLDKERAKAVSVHLERKKAGANAKHLLKQNGSICSSPPVNVNMDVPVGVLTSSKGEGGGVGEEDSGRPPISMSPYQKTLFLSVANDYPIQENIAGAEAEWAMIFPPPDQVLVASMRKAISEQKVCGCLDARHDLKPHLKAWIKNKRWNDQPKEEHHGPSRVAGREVPGSEADRARYAELDRVRREGAARALGARAATSGKHKPLPAVRGTPNSVHQPDAGMLEPGVRGPAGPEETTGSHPGGYPGPIPERQARAGSA